MPEAVSILNDLDVPVKISGGPYATARPSEVIQYCDAVFLGEAEISIRNFLRSLYEHGTVDTMPNIPGVAFKGRENPEGYQRISDLDSISFRGWELMADNLSKMRSSPYRNISDNIVSMMTSRGCRNKCTFCASTINGSYRYRSVESVEAELELIEYLRQKQGIVPLQSVRLDDDDLFLRDENELAKLFEMFAKKGLTTSGSGAFHNAVPGKIELLAEYGVKSLFLGVETHEGRRGNVSIGPKGQITDEQITETLETLRKNNIKSIAGYIIGFPDETREDIGLTIDTMVNLPADYPSLRILQVHPGTKIWEWVESNMHLYPELQERPFTHVDRERWPTEPSGLPQFHPTMKKEELIELRNQANARAFSRRNIVAVTVEH